jgi:hypothetical protein
MSTAVDESCQLLVVAIDINPNQLLFARQPGKGFTPGYLITGYRLLGFAFICVQIRNPQRHGPRQI